MTGFAFGGCHCVVLFTTIRRKNLFWVRLESMSIHQRTHMLRFGGFLVRLGNLMMPFAGGLDVHLIIQLA